DNGNSGAGGPLAASASTSLQTSAVNDAPVVGAPATIDTSIAGASPLSGIFVSDVDAAAADVTLQFAAPGGTLTATAGGGVSVAGSGTSFITLTGSISALSAFLATTPPSYAGPAAAMLITLNDGGNTGSGGAQVGTANVQLVPTILLRDGFEDG